MDILVSRPNGQSGGSPLFGCSPVFIQYIRGRPSCRTNVTFIRKFRNHSDKMTGPLEGRGEGGKEIAVKTLNATSVIFIQLQ